MGRHSGGGQTVAPPSRPNDLGQDLIFDIEAWWKLKFFLHVGDTEVGAQAVSRPGEPLTVAELHFVDQECTGAYTEFTEKGRDQFTALTFEGMERGADKGEAPRHYGLVWCHTHPGDSPSPSPTDEDCFEKGWGGKLGLGVMFIMARGGATYARVSLTTELCRVQYPLTPRVRFYDEHAWLKTADLNALRDSWLKEYADNVRRRTFQAPAWQGYNGQGASGSGTGPYGGLTSTPPTQRLQSHDWRAQRTTRQAVEEAAAGTVFAKVGYDSGPLARVTKRPDGTLHDDKGGRVDLLDLDRSPDMKPAFVRLVSVPAELPGLRAGSAAGQGAGGGEDDYFVGSIDAVLQYAETGDTFDIQWRDDGNWILGYTKTGLADPAIRGPAGGPVDPKHLAGDRCRIRRKPGKSPHGLGAGAGAGQTTVTAETGATTETDEGVDTTDLDGITAATTVADFVLKIPLGTRFWLRSDVASCCAVTQSAGLGRRVVVERSGHSTVYSAGYFIAGPGSHAWWHHLDCWTKHFTLLPPAQRPAKGGQPKVDETLSNADFFDALLRGDTFDVTTGKSRGPYVKEGESGELFNVKDAHGRLHHFTDIVRGHGGVLGDCRLFEIKDELDGLEDELEEAEMEALQKELEEEADLLLAAAERNEESEAKEEAAAQPTVTDTPAPQGETNRDDLDDYFGNQLLY